MRALGIILAGGKADQMGELSNKRAVPAMPVAGSFRGIDFSLSSMANSQIPTVAVLTQYNARSLNEHLSSSKWWDFGRKKGGLYVFQPVITKDNDSWYQGTADAIYQNIEFIKNCHEPYVVIASGDTVYKLDFNKVLDFHISKQADITVVCTSCRDETQLERFGVMELNADGRIVEFQEKPKNADSSLISTGIYIVRRRLLIDLIEKTAQNGYSNFVRDILIRYKNTKRFYGYLLDSYWSNIATVESYYRTNMDFLKPQIRDHFFRGESVIKTRLYDLPAAKYNPGAEVKNSLLASGTIVNGVVENSVISRDVYLGNHCVVKNSVILHHVYIGDNAHIENCIVESGSTIYANEIHTGEGAPKVLVEVNSRVGL